MKAWVTTLFGSSLKLITEKLQEVDLKVKIASTDKVELTRLREEKVAWEKAAQTNAATGEKKSRELSSSEKRKRGVVRTPVDNSPRGNRLRSRGSKAPAVDQELAAAQEEEDPIDEEDIDIIQNAFNKEEEENGDECGLATYMKMRQKFYNLLHYTRVQELSKQKSISYFKKDQGEWELAKVDLQEYTDMLKEERPVEAA
ncbi:hypothetical protein CBR_g3653 [Chara braunii]|uniref:Uncharacterized protein n=1 Tax=Chara braunii TaxID=69332 RepID=A0A388KFX1_CHABU|nr:hypothetical protein CBR_g3653 [Chara braunii]|eukprot:GBG68954.1 hypothetical protein CBR_g3653 [Chara braunii]